jgi:rod shape determining protein RodA
VSLLEGRSSLQPTPVGISGWRRFLVRFDWPLFLTIAALTTIGLLNLYSATYRTPHSVKFDAQLIWVGIGLVTLFVVAYLDYRMWHRLAWIGLGCAVALIVAVRLFAEGHGAQRWLHVAVKGFGLGIQPSELAKIAVILALARVLHDRANDGMKGPETVAALGAIVLPILLIAIQPDLGTSVVVALIVGSVCVLLLRKLWPLAGAGLAAMAALPLLWDRMHDYQKDRVLAFLDPSADPTGAGWHTTQSIFAVGSGKVSGKGFLNATQNHFNFLPEYWTDFPFSVWAEEWGFVGSVALLAIFIWLVLWIVNIAVNARDVFGTAVCLGVAAMIFWHVAINVAMVLGMAPVVGLTLPLISYGGSSMLTIFIGLGLVASVSARRMSFAP